MSEFLEVIVYLYLLCSEIALCLSTCHGIFLTQEIHLDENRTHLRSLEFLMKDEIREFGRK